MPKAPLKLQSKDGAEEVKPTLSVTEIEPHSQKKKAEPGRFWLQIDRQTKSSHNTLEEAEAKGLLIKKNFSNLQVSVYDKKEGSNTILAVPA